MGVARMPLPYRPEDDLLEVLYTSKKIQDRVRDIAAEISRDYAGTDFIMLGVLRGAFVFIADLLRALTVPCSVDFMAFESYGDKTQSDGVVRMTKDLEETISGQRILVVEDIIDSGQTLNYLLNLLNARHPADIQICTLLDKPDRREVDIAIRYCGFSIPDEFVVGYGLDYAQRYRGLSCIGILKPHIYGPS